MSSEIRLANLKQLLDDRYGGRIAELARAIERDDAYVWQLLNDERNIGERVARHIEIKLELAPGALDAENMRGPVTLTSDERDLLEAYRRAPTKRKDLVRQLLAEAAPEHSVHEPTAEYPAREPLFRGRDEPVSDKKRRFKKT